MGRYVSNIIKGLRNFKEDFTPSGPRVEIFSCKEAIIEGCRGILEYGSENIKLNIGFGSVDFTGENMYAESFSGNSIVIKGKICKIEYLVGK